MPKEQITTTEYSCTRCYYKWITRKNGKESSTKPHACARCKTYLWDTPRSHDMTGFYKRRFTYKTSSTKDKAAAQMSDKERKILQIKKASAEDIPLELVQDFEKAFGYS